jgi:hypothetical protein
MGLDDKQKAAEELNLALQAKPGLPAARFAFDHMR